MRVSPIRWVVTVILALAVANAVMNMLQDIATSDPVVVKVVAKPAPQQQPAGAVAKASQMDKVAAALRQE